MDQLDERIGILDNDIKRVERRMESWFKQDKACQAIADIPGVGLLRQPHY